MLNPFPPALAIFLSPARRLRERPALGSHEPILTGFTRGRQAAWAAHALTRIGGWTAAGRRWRRRDGVAPGAAILTTRFPDHGPVVVLTGRVAFLATRPF